MPEWPFITDGIHGDVPVNFYPIQDSDKTAILLGSPGLKSVCSLPYCTEVRGLWEWGGYLYAVAQRGSESVLWRVTAGGSYAEMGSFTTSASGPVWMVNNPTQLLIVDGVSGYVFTPATGVFKQILDADFPGGGTADYQDSYGLISQPGTNKWFFSAVDDFLAYDALDFYEKMAKPDGLTALKSHLREVWLFGPQSTEVWYNAGGDNSSVQNPTFARNSGGMVPFGIGAAGTIVGDTAGPPLTWLSNFGVLIQAKGYTPSEVSNQMFARAVQGDPAIPGSGYPIFSDAVAFGYVDAGHAFYQISFPSGGETWVLDTSLGVLHKKQSYTTGGAYGRHRANCYARLGNKHYVGDYTNGKVYEMSTSYFDDDGHPIRGMLCSKEFNSGLQFTTFPDVQIEVDSGAGVPITTDPQLGLQISNDGGKTYSATIQRSSGMTGQYGHRSIWRMMGGGYRRMYRMVTTDPALRRVLGLHWDVEGQR